MTTTAQPPTPPPVYRQNPPTRTEVFGQMLWRNATVCFVGSVFTVLIAANCFYLMVFFGDDSASSTVLELLTALVLLEIGVFSTSFGFALATTIVVAPIAAGIDAIAFEPNHGPRTNRAITISVLLGLGEFAAGVYLLVFSSMAVESFGWAGFVLRLVLPVTLSVAASTILGGWWATASYMKRTAR